MDHADIHELRDAVRLIQALAAAMAERVPDWTVLHAAAELGHAAAVTFFVANGVPVDVPTRDGRTALHVAASRGHVGAVRALLDAGADWRARDREGCLPASLAERGRHRDALALLQRAADGETSGG